MNRFGGPSFSIKYNYERCGNHIEIYCEHRGVDGNVLIADNPVDIVFSDDGGIITLVKERGPHFGGGHTDRIRLTADDFRFVAEVVLAEIESRRNGPR